MSLHGGVDPSPIVFRRIWFRVVRVFRGQSLRIDKAEINVGFIRGPSQDSPEKSLRGLPFIRVASRPFVVQLKRYG